MEMEGDIANAQLLLLCSQRELGDIFHDHQESG